MNRRRFIRGLLESAALLAGGTWPSNVYAGQASSSDGSHQFVFTQAKYGGGDWDPHPLAVPPLMGELMRRTSIDAASERHVITLTDPDLFSYPFLYISGKYDFRPFSRDEIDVLRRYLSFGGFLLADNALGEKGYGFDTSFRREMKRVFPNQDFRKLPLTHAALRSYYLIRKIGGRVASSPHLEGIDLGNSTPVIYSLNDLGGAWARDPLGNWMNECTPGGEEQRRSAFHLGVNLILYAMTENYKQDLIHVPFIRRRLTQ